MNNQTLHDAAKYTFVDPVLYVGLVAANPVLDSQDTMASHPGWTEVVSYSGNRPLWEPYGVSEAGLVTAKPTEFNMTGAAVIAGVFLTTDSTKGGTAGRLRGPELIKPVTVASGEKFKVIIEAQARMV